MYDREEAGAIAARWTFVNRQLAIGSAAILAAGRAAAVRDWPTQTRLLKVAMAASDAVAKVYGVLTRPPHHAGDGLAVAREFMELTMRARRENEED